VGRDSSVSIATGYGLEGPGIEPWWGARFSATVQTGPGAHPASCIKGTGSFLGVKSGRGVTLTPHHLLGPLVMKEYSYTSTPPMGRTACTEPQCLYKGDLYGAGWSGNRTLVGGEIFRACPDRPWGPPSLLYKGYRVFPGGKERPGRDADPSPPSSAVGHERLELYLYSPYRPYGLYRASVPVQG